MTQVQTKGWSHRKKITFDITDGGCFECTSHHFGAGGYPRIYWNRHSMNISRFIYRECFGEIPEGHSILHRCDNPHCINPEHLFTGTAMDNYIDRRDKGRSKYLKGSESGTSKLKEHQVVIIKRMIQEGVTNKIIADSFGVTTHAIQDIRREKTWKHILWETDKPTMFRKITK